MFLTRVSVSQPVFAAMVMVGIMVLGIFSFNRLAVEQFPDIDFPVVAAVVTYQGASPEAVETDIIKPIEETVNTISGIDTIQSIAQPSRAMVIMQFDLEVNSADAVQDVREKLNQIAASFPDAANDPVILRFDPAAMPLISLAISSDSMASEDLTQLADDVIVPRLSMISGVGSASVVGGLDRQVNILLDPDRMNAFGVTASEIIQAVGAENVDISAGEFDDGIEVQSVQIEGRIENQDDFAQIIVARRGGQPVHLGDVAHIELGTAQVTSLAMLNGQSALAIDVVKQQGANTVGVAEDIRHAVAELTNGQLPEGVQIDVVVDGSTAVEESYHTVLNMIIEGAALATLIVFLFLNSWRSTVITGLTLPISLIGTMTVLLMLGFTLNVMTLMALSLAVGLLIDDAIVVRENIMRHLHMGKTHVQAALDGTNEIGLAVLATTLSIVAVFLPVAFMEGIMGRFFLQFGVTVAVAVSISMFVAFTLDPMLSSIWYDPAADKTAKKGPIWKLINHFDVFFEHLSHGYRRVLRWSLRHRFTTLFIALLALVGAFALIPRVGGEFAPAGDSSEFTVTLETPAGSSLDYTALKVQQATDILNTFPEVIRTYATVASGSSVDGTTTATITVAMVPSLERTITPTEITIPVRQALTALPGVEVKVAAAGGMGMTSAPIQIRVQGESLNVLGELSDDLVGRLRGITGLADVTSSMSVAQPVLGVRINRDAASDLGLSLGSIGNMLQPMMAGTDVGDWTDDADNSFTVYIRLPSEIRSDAAELGKLPVGVGSDGTLIQLAQVADIVQSVGASEINRYNQMRTVLVEANIEGVDFTTAMAATQSAIDALDLPPGYRAGMGGEAEDLGEAAGSAAQALLLAVIAIYLVLASQFGSLTQPFAIMMALPLSLIGVVVGLLVGGSTLNIYSAIGFIMLMGLVVKNAILLVDNANQHVRGGMNLYDSLIEAGFTRFRPIIMTTLAMIFGMLPMALNLHGGSGTNAPMAHAVIGGLISSTILTLVVVPVVLTFIDTFGKRVRRFFPSAPDHGHSEATGQAHD
ncbi:RND multidrug efflux transporter, acriflavin resistance protein [Ketogulonicigenium vulgare]|uniref:Multidrug efflux transporter AcrB/AcrD/AcrF family protein n=1 Tax=Ketogulonicigenium vulgare (strain WSH-001) TaxID=759362 RepID=F9Y789_KETVW|nr:efflux RND transporter permease subunit [Ketogulonicigenium vulgare]AEM41017.1 Multidrug efflux transporter AcrB/AcrD/AcrF family protein [Ketogulonicigenium vulgare WSH-001]ALJ81168.1 nodulation protein NolG [Ketogulonicigenium vulgare]AOZ54744.1 RND multidrug efflux transporter, acriflavin resistance protein [Ketogulonicigenium vulgare]